MTTTYTVSRFGLAFVWMNLSLLGGPGTSKPEVGVSLKVQQPLGEYKSTVLDADLGFGLGVRARFNFQPRHALSGRLEYDWYPEGGSPTRGSNYLLEESYRVRELSLGLNYEWLYNGGSRGGYLLLGPVYRRWSDHREAIYSPTLPGPIPVSRSLNTTPSRLGLNVGWGYRGDSDSVIELHFVTSKYGSSGLSANSLQVSFIQYW